MNNLSKNILLAVVMVLNFCLLKSNDQQTPLTTTPVSSAPEILVISIPKAGTHLIQKCLEIIINRFDVSYKDRINHFHFRHYDKNLQELKSLNKNFQYSFLMSRDPRDQIISFIHYIFDKWFVNEDRAGIKVVPSFSNYKNLTFDEVLLNLICFGSSWYQVFPDKNCDQKNPDGCNGIDNFYSSYLDWLKDPNYKFCLIKFENLVGPKGGGSLDLQAEEVSKIFKHLNIEQNSKNIKLVADSLFGGTNTFREGQIGSWKKYFKEIHKHCFKKIAGQLLIDLGYEKDLNW
jgi:hypothetical protein